MRTNLARLTFLQADNDNKLKRALKSRINSYKNEFFDIGDKVSFKEEGKTKWSGPAKIIGVDGKVLIVKYGNNSRRIHKSRAVKEGYEYHKNYINSDESKSPRNKPDEATKSPSEIYTTSNSDESKSSANKTDNASKSPSEKQNTSNVMK